MLFINFFWYFNRFKLTLYLKDFEMNLKSLTKRNWGFTAFVFLMLLVNIIVVLTTDLQVSRVTRLITVSVLFIFYISTKQVKNMWVSLGFCCFLLRDIFVQFFEQPLGFKGCILFGCISYIVIILECLPKFSLKKINLGLIAFATLLILANTCALHFIIEMLSLHFRDGFEVFLFYIYGAFMIMMCLIAISYNNKYNSTRSLRYILLVFLFYFFRPLWFLFAYYFEFEFFYILYSMFFVPGYLDYSQAMGLNNEIAREEIYQYEMINKNL